MAPRFAGPEDRGQFLAVAHGISDKSSKRVDETLVCTDNLVCLLLVCGVSVAELSGIESSTLRHL